MRKLVRRIRVSPALVVSVIALIVAASGSAGAFKDEKATSSGVVKGRSAVGGVCDPASSTFVNCVKVRMALPHSGPVLLVGTGSWSGDADAANGQCHLVVEGSQVGLAPNPGQSVGAHADGAHEGSVAITGITDQLDPGKHTFRLACLESTADFKLGSSEISAVLLN